MIKEKLILLFLLITAICNSQIDSTWTYKKDKIKIPFELLNNLIIIDVKINNSDLKMILDTGSENNVIFSFPNDVELETKNLEKKFINGFGANEPIAAYLVKNNTLSSYEFVDKKFDFLVIDATNLSFLNKIGKEINGIVGLSFFKNHLIEINYSKKEINIYSSRAILSKRKIKKYNKEKIKLRFNKPYIEIASNLKNNNFNLNLLMDTGLSDGLWLFNPDSTIIPEKNIKDLLGIGLSGEINGKRARVKELKIGTHQFNEILVSFPNLNNVSGLIMQNRNGSVGGEILKRFNWFIDYKNETVYMKPNIYFKDPFNYNMSGIEIQQNGKEVFKKGQINNSIKTDTNNFNTIVYDNSYYIYNYVLVPVFEISFIREKSSGEKAGLKVGDKIISINNIYSDKLTLQIISDLFHSKEGKKIKIKLERQGKLIEKQFLLEKII
jgi:hypothetical protein